MMERVVGNLAALQEEDDEEAWEELSESESDGELQDNIKKAEPNKFDNLCDGVINSMAIVHAALSEYLELKDELLQHALPPNVLMNFGLVTSKLYRVMSDLHNPVNELIRLVRVYSTPWEEKSAALKKLHEDYESKQRQLNIAIKRLQLVDQHSKRIAKEKRIMNWEKLFAKLTTAKGHGRRWKFRMEAFKQKASKGIEHLQSYFHDLDESSESESEVDFKPRTPTSVMQQHQPSRSVNETPATETWLDDDDDEDDEDGSSSDEEEEEGDEQDGNGSEEGQHIIDIDMPSIGGTSSAKGSERSAAGVTYIKPPMKDATVWTAEPQYDTSLHVRIYKPLGLEHRDLKCAITYGTQFFKSGKLDEVPDDESSISEEGSRAGSKTLLRKPGASLIGSRGGSGGSKSRPKAAKHKDNDHKENEGPGRYEEFVFDMPYPPEPGVKRPESILGENVRLAVHWGPEEEIVAMATVDVDELISLDLPSLLLSGPSGDDFEPFTASHAPSSSIWDEEDEDEEGGFISAPALDRLQPLTFPLYSIHASRSNATQAPCGTLPLVFYWGKKPKPAAFNRQTGTESMRDLVLDMLGIDIDTTTKQDLHKEHADEALSVQAWTPEPQIETVLKEEYDDLVKKHNEDLQLLQEEYEARLEEFAVCIRVLQESQMNQENESRSVRSAGSLRSRQGTSPVHSQSVGDAATTPRPPRKKDTTKNDGKSRKKVKLGRVLPQWGESLPPNFFDRLKMFSEESLKNRQELSERLSRDVKEDYERKLAGQNRLSAPGGDMYSALQDVTLPAVFMPLKSGNVFNPRAYRYFHPTGSSDVRLTQPPSIFQLPPLQKDKMSVVNLFNLSQAVHRTDSDWLASRYYEESPLPADQPGLSPTAPLAPSVPLQETGLSPMSQLSENAQPHDANDMVSRHSNADNTSLSSSQTL